MNGDRERATARIASVAERFRDAVRLAQLASLAVRIEPHLLRRLRRDLLRDVDVGAEADLWFCQLVDSRGVDAIVLDRHVAAVLRDDLALHPRLDEVIAILVEAHRDEPSTITLEEKVNILAVQQGRAALGAIDGELRAAIVAMRESDARAREIARWFLRAAPRLHPIVQECPNAIALLVSASMLLGRRGPEEIPERKTSLRDVGWLVSPTALVERIDVGVERLPDALRFVEPGGPAVDTAAAPPVSIARLSIPRQEPRLVEVAWQVAGTVQQRVVEARPGCFVMLDDNATDLRVVTLAGDEYELVPMGGTDTAAQDRVLDLTPYRDIVQACVQVRTLTDPVVAGTCVRVHAQYVFTAREPFGREQGVALIEGSERFLRPVVPMPDYDDMIAVESTRGGTGLVSLATAPFTAEQSEDGPLERRPEKAIVIGYDGDTLRGVEGDAEIDDFTGQAFRVLVPDARAWFSGLNGGPVIIDGRVRGIVNAVHVPRMGDTAILNVVGAARIHDLLRRVLEREQAAPRSEPAAQQQTVSQGDAVGGEDPAGETPERPPDEPLTITPEWLFDVCATIHLPGDVGAPATGLVVSDRLVVSTATRLRGLRTFAVVTRSRDVEARLLDFASEGPLVYLGLTGAERFESWAPLIRRSVRVRTASDPPDPVDAMLAVARNGLRTIPVRDARRAGVVHARDPDGYRFNVVIGEPRESVDDIAEAVLVWGDTVAGLVIAPPTLDEATLTMRAEVLSVNVIRDGLEGATAALEALAGTGRSRAFVSVTSSDLEQHRRHVVERLRAHGITAILREERLRDRNVDPIATSELFVLLVGPYKEAVDLDLSMANFEYMAAIRDKVDVMAFLWRDDSNIGDQALLRWRNEIKEKHPVQFFDESPESLHIDDAIVQWKERRERGVDEPVPPPPNAEATADTDVDTPPTPDRGAPSGHYCAKVVLCGESYTGKSEILPKIPGLHLDRDHGGLRGVLWMDRPAAAPALHAGLVFYETSSDEEHWPQLVLDLEDAALAVIVVRLARGVEDVANAQWSRVRAVHATVPILIVLTYSETQQEDQREVLRRLSEIALRDRHQDVTSGDWLHVGGVVTLSVHGSQGIDTMVDEALHHIEWSHLPAMAPEDFDAAMAQAQTIFEFQPRENVARLSTVRRPGWAAQLGRLLGERTFASDGLVIRHPALFNRVVSALVSQARQQTRGLPAVRLKDVKDVTEDAAWSVEPDAVIRAVARDLARRQLAMVVEKTTDAVLVLPGLIEAAAEIAVPAEARPVLRAEWTGTGRDVFIELFVHFAYALGNTVEAGWQPNLSRGSGRVMNGPALYLQVTETGEVAELLATAGDDSDGLKVDEATRALREGLETIMSGNASLSLDSSPS